MGDFWYHGTSYDFSNWEIPPPGRISEIEIPHTALFFTKDLNYAKGVGNRVYATSLNSAELVVDMTKISEASEEIRKLVIKNPLAAINAYYQTPLLWRDAWVTGAALRMAAKTPAELMIINRYANRFREQIIDGLLKSGQDTKLADEIVLQNLTRGLIEHICSSAKSLGYSGIHGYEIDRFSLGGVGKIEWLAIFDKTILQPPRRI